jgi:chromate transport protein ChrA
VKGALIMETQSGTKKMIQSIFSGVKVAVLYLLVGMVLDYLITQALSQLVIANCSEDCYFRYFNSIFIVIVLLSLAGGVRSGLRAFKQQSENQ